MIDLGEREGDCQCCTVVDTVALRELQEVARRATALRCACCYKRCACAGRDVQEVSQQTS